MFNIREVKGYIEKHKLFTPQDRLLVTVSGGADSTALLRILLNLNYACEVAHCNFHLRGEESNRDEQFVRNLCKELKVPVHIAHFDTQKEASTKHISIEMAARQLRYDWFEQLRQAQKLTKIVVAHHLNDNVETFLLNMIRGTGIRGLQGIQPKNGYIVRPLLETSRQDLESYLHSINQPYVIDSSNLEDAYVRNKIRHAVIPVLQELNPSIVNTLSANAKRLHEATLIYEAAIKKELNQVRTPDGLSITLLLKSPSPQVLIYEALHPLGFTETQIANIHKSIYNNQSGKQFYTNSWRVIRDRDKLLILPLTNIQKPILQITRLVRTETFQIPSSPDIACLDADLIKSPLHLRLCQRGDTFYPLGMSGKKAVSDYLTNRKYSINHKERQWVLCCGEDIIWLVGERIDDRYKIKAKTTNILYIKIVDTKSVE